jgi:UV DNA damage endonuclease
VSSSDTCGKIDRIGFACVLSDGSCSTNHTFRLSALSPARLAEAAHQNLDDLERMLFMMRSTPMRMLRLGSSIVPFASHDALDWDWKPLVAGRLRLIAKRNPDFRFSMHPGQYTILNSPDPEVVGRAVAELDYSCSVLDLMGLDDSHKVVIHGGGIYGQREESTERLVRALADLPAHIRRRLVLENDEKLFSLEQILEVAEQARLPVVFDLHHHQINPGTHCLQRSLDRVGRLWQCRPKVHLSSQRPGARIGAHDDLLSSADLKSLCRVLPWKADLMVEAKSKELAAMQAWHWLEANGCLAAGE